MSIALAIIALLLISSPAPISTFTARPTKPAFNFFRIRGGSSSDDNISGGLEDNEAAIMRKASRGIPKHETGVYDLYEKYPGSDGTDIKIAIMDTGCCLQAAGLSGTTSDGKTPKYIDFIDCTGDGDVPMGKSVAFDYATNSSIVGLSGRNISLGDWARDVKSLKLGAVRLFELLPRGVERRVKKERKEAFMIKHRALISDTQSKLDKLAKDPNGGDDNNDDEKKNSSASAAVDKEKKELKLMLEQLNAIIESYEDYGPLLDIVMFEEDGTWKVAIDLEAIGDLYIATPMAPFAYARQVGELGFGSHVSFCIQVYDDGNTLSIVTDSGSHGTHVAGIAAAFFESGASGEGEQEYDLSGKAPGAQILALKIGDGRLGSAETGTGLIRGLIAAKNHGCDLINLSFGEPSWQPDIGRVSEVFAKAVNDWGMAVFTSAGNDGPALSSLGSPGSLTAPITVGAYVSSEMMDEQYSTLPLSEGDEAPLEGASYYFSSRGPTPDGYFPDICGPGGAISPIPRHGLQGKAQYHGTSMSSPNVCGVAASILSAVRQNGAKSCSPIELKRSLINTASQPPGIVEPFSQGSGIVSALDCAEYIFANHGKEGQNVAIDVTVPSRNARGIYIRDEQQLEGSMEFGVLIKPRFSHANQRTSSELDELLSLELPLLLRSSAEDWVTCPDGMTLTSAMERNGQTFAVRLNTQGMKPGAHFATVDAFTHDKRKLFSLPITVVVPHSMFVSVDEPTFTLNAHENFRLRENLLDYSSTFQLQPGLPSRRFITVPSGAEWATIRLKSSQPTPTGTSPRIVLHAVPFARGDLHNAAVQLKKIYQVKDAGVEEEYHLRVKGGSCLELCLQLLWLANPSPASVTADIEFHSFNIQSPTLVSSQPIVITAAREFGRLGVGTPLRAEKFNPECKLTSVLQTLRPKEVDIKLGSTERDSEPLSDAEVASNAGEKSTQAYEMRTQYQFSIEGDKAIEVRPSFPSIFSQLYDSPVDSQIWSLEDSNAQILGFGSAIHHASPISLKKGNYTVTLLLRQPNRYSLEQLKDIPCEVSLKLPDALSCNLYDQLDKASTPSIKDDGRTPLGSKLLPKGSHQDLYVARPIDALPTWIAPGDVLEGSLKLDKDKEVTSMKLLYVAPPKPQTKDEKKDKSDSSEKKDSLEDVVFKAKLQHLTGLRKNATLYEETAAQLRAERPASVPLLSELLSFALERPMPSDETDEDEADDEDVWRLSEVELLYNAMQKANGGPIDVASLAQYFGINSPDEGDLEDDEEAKTLNKEMNEQRDALKKILLERAALAGRVADKNAAGVDTFDQAVKELKKWVSPDNLKDDEEKIKLSVTLAKHGRLCQSKDATAISILLKAKKDLTGKSLKQIDEELLKVYDRCEGMCHLSVNLKEGMDRRFPALKRGV